MPSSSKWPRAHWRKKIIWICQTFLAKSWDDIEFVSEEKAIELIEPVIGFGEVSTAEKSNFSFYNSKIYELFGELLKKD